MFVPLNKDAHKIVNISSRAVREEVLNLGQYAQQATIMEMKGKKVALTSDHWTGANQLMYGALTSHTSSLSSGRWLSWNVGDIVGKCR